VGKVLVDHEETTEADPIIVNEERFENTSNEEKILTLPGFSIDTKKSGS